MDLFHPEIFLQGVFEIDRRKGMTMIEIGEGYTVEFVKNHTGCVLNISPDLKPMQQA